MAVTGGTFIAYWGLLNRNGRHRGASARMTTWRRNAPADARKGRLVIPTIRLAHRFWESRLKAGEVKMLRMIAEYVERKRAWLSRAPSLKAWGWPCSGGTFTATSARSFANRLVAKDGEILKIHPG